MDYNKIQEDKKHMRLYKANQEILKFTSLQVSYAKPVVHQQQVW